jgi:hypothetical protein
VVKQIEYTKASILSLTEQRLPNTEYAIITFSSKDERNMVLSTFKHPTLRLVIAPEPHDINWKSLCYNSKARIFRKIITYIIVSILVAFNFMVSLYSSYKEEKNQYGKSIFDYIQIIQIPSITMLVTNSISTFIIPMCVKYMNHQS